MRKILNGLFVIGVYIGLTTAEPVNAESLDDKIGTVIVHLFRAVISDVTGSVTANAAAKGWDNEFLAQKTRPTNVVQVTYQSRQQNTYDAVRRVWVVDSLTIDTRQTFGVWTVTLLNQPTLGKSNTELAELVTSVASNCLNRFTNRVFQYDGEYDNVKVFVLSIESGCECGDWRDVVIGVVDGTSVRFASGKKLTVPTAAVLSTQPELNTKWFDIVGSGSKIRTR